MGTGLDTLPRAHQVRVTPINLAREHTHILLVLVLVNLSMLEMDRLGQTNHDVLTLVLCRRLHF